MTNPADANAVADYLNAGGQVQKGEETIPATAREVIAYLASHGVMARYSPGDAKPYLCNRKRIGENTLIEMANRFRCGEHAPPFALKLDPLDLKAWSTSMS